MDIAPVLSKRALVNYLAKYVAKCESKSLNFHNIVSDLCDKGDVSIKSIIQKLYIKVDTYEHRGKSILQKYAERLPNYDMKSLWWMAKNFSFSNKKLRINNPAIVVVCPKFTLKMLSDSKSQSNNELYYGFKVILHVPWRDLSQFKITDNISWHDLYLEHQQEIDADDYEAISIPAEEEITSDDDNEFLDPSYDVTTEYYMVSSAMLPDQNTQRTSLGSRHIDVSYNWAAASDEYSQYGSWQELASFISEQKKHFQSEENIPPYPNVEFNEEQASVLALVDSQIDMIKSTCGSVSNIGKSVIVQGSAGTGKSLLIRALTNRVMTEFGQKSIMLLAPTGVAAVNISGSTIHSKLHISSINDFSDLEKEEFCNDFRDTKFIVIDEYSMIGCGMMGMIDKRLKQATGNYGEPFGGLFIYFFDTPLYATKKITDVLKQHGKMVWDNIELSIFLKQVHRQSDLVFTALLSRLSKGMITHEDYEILKERFTIIELHPENNEPVPVAAINADHNSDVARNGTSDQAGGLVPSLLLAPSCRIMLRTNLWTEQGLVNGAMGHLVDIVYDQSINPDAALPKVLMCVFDDYNGPFLGNDSSLKLVPIPIITRSWKVNGASCSRSQFPVQVAFAVTIHKWQGLTLSKVKINIGEGKEMCPGLSFVAISRTKALTSLLLEPFSSRRLLNINNSKVLKAKLDFEQELKNKQLMLSIMFHMSSPSKPVGAKLRNAKTMIRGQDYKIDMIYQEISKFPDSVTGEFALKTIAVFKDLETFLFYVYLCKDYDNKDPESEYIVSINNDIQNGKDVRVVYYGSIGSYNVTKLLLDGEAVNQSTLAGVSAKESNRPAPSAPAPGPSSPSV
ncbi:uncharacterized protein LOC127751653 [Frankliniella occidentalis]|uniref:ATP-dependent DNA helicase n=1 Tax=Frankliniella occidentalis TaxID=133901 RepID=A0A9C6X918_FRAOC|nr:uncharacterized protein LOC127751653 [Frankliniella occidentalis]